MTSPILMPDFSKKINLTATKSGVASDSSVYGRALQDGDFLSVPSGVVLQWDLTSSPNLAGIYLQGVLDCGAASGNKALNVGTLAANGGALLCGSCLTNTQLNGTFRLTFLDQAPDPAFDPAQFGTGLVAMGATIDMCGSANKDSWLWTAACRKGDTSITLLSTPNDWNVGDQLVVPGTFLSPAQDEVVTIAAVNGAVITLTSPLAYDHIPVPGPQGQVNSLPIGNLSRRIVIQSANPNGTRGHCMFMHDMMGMPTVTNVCHILVKDCGRTLATQPVTDPTYDANGVPIPSTLLNPRARYAWHSHRQGQAGPALQTWDGIVVWGFKKWAFDNHDSNVKATNLVAFDGQGGCFATERGSEIGEYTDCLGIRTSGAPGLYDSRINNQDFGWAGHGIWLQGPGVICSGNVLSGHPEAGVHSFLQGVSAIDLGILAATFPRSLMPPSWGTAPYDPVMTAVPLFGVSDNVAFGCAIGHYLSWNELQANFFSTGTVRSTMVNPVAWNCNIGCELSYNYFCGFDGAQLVGPNYAPGSVGIRVNGAYSDQNLYTNPQISGFEIGCNLGVTSVTTTDGFFQNVHDFDTPAGLGFGVQYANNAVILKGSPKFADVPTSALNGRTRLNFAVPQTGMAQQRQLPLCYFVPRRTILPDGSQLYFPEQAPSSVPFPASGSYVDGFPAALIGLTNQQLAAQWGSCLCGSPAQQSATPYPLLTNGIVGPAAPVNDYWYLPDGGQSGTSLTYILTAYNATTPASPRFTATVSLQPGWNPVVEMIGGLSQLFFVFGHKSTTQPVATTTTLQAVEIRSLQCVAKVNAVDGSIVNEGVYNFACGVISVQAPVANGVASAILAGVPVGTDTVQGIYNDSGGTANFQPSSGSTQTQVN